MDIRYLDIFPSCMSSIGDVKFIKNFTFLIGYRERFFGSREFCCKRRLFDFNPLPDAKEE